MQHTHTHIHTTNLTTWQVTLPLGGKRSLGIAAYFSYLATLPLNSSSNCRGCGYSTNHFEPWPITERQHDAEFLLISPDEWKDRNKLVSNTSTRHVLLRRKSKKRKPWIRNIQQHLRPNSSTQRPVKYTLMNNMAWEVWQMSWVLH